MIGINRSTRPWWRFVSALAACVCLLAVSAAPVSTAGQYDRRWLAEILGREVNGTNAWTHLQAISAATAANGGNRVSGSAGYDASAGYLTRTLSEAGYQVRRQEFTFPDYETVAETAAVTAPVNRPLHALLAYFSVSTPDQGLARPAVLPKGQATGCTAADYAGADVAGKIVLVDIGACTTAAKQLTAAAAGAAAMLMNVNYPRETMNIRYRINPPGDARIPTATLPRGEAEQLKADIARGPVSVRLDLRSRAVTTRAYNLIADTRSGSANDTVVLGAHLDSVDITPGMNDNAAAAAMELEIALRLAPYAGHLKNRVRFAWWAAEEKGLVGSRHYVDQLTPPQRDGTALYLNLEMIASPNFARLVYNGRTPNGPAPRGSERITKVITDYFAARNLPTAGRDLDDRSDHAPFVAAGIPSGGVNAGAETLKPPEWVRLFGGTAGEMLDSCYHQPCDTLDNVNKTIFDQFGRSVGWATGRFAIDVSDVRGNP
ncbi:M28 family peptidase [Amycolatopsis samaneae]|uniref:M28 family peptidase n=1 Tax=Amycolatopsis samaneae TaxID=664691 RepID=A0ABW5GJP2_9PSEU